MRSMQAGERDARDWIDGKRIEGYCARRGYTETQIIDIREMHRLHLIYPEGSPKGTPLQALKAASKTTPGQRAFLREAARAKDARFGNSFLRLAGDSEYAEKILTAYKTDVKPALNL